MGFPCCARFRGVRDDFFIYLYCVVWFYISSDRVASFCIHVLYVSCREKGFYDKCSVKFSTDVIRKSKKMKKYPTIWTGIELDLTSSSFCEFHST